MTYKHTNSLSIYLNSFIVEEENTQDKNTKKDDKSGGNEINVNDRKAIYTNTINRLAYLNYLIKKENNGKLKKKLKIIFDTFIELSFKDGHLKPISDMLSDIKSIEIDNKGQIPGLPSNKILKALDTKMIRFKDYDKETFDANVSDIKAQFDDDKSNKNDGNSEADTILNNPNKILKLDDEEEKKLITKLKIAEKSNPGICRALCVIDITSGLDIKKSDAPEDDKKENEKDKSNDEDSKIVDDLTKDLPDDIKSLMGESVNNTSLMNYLLQQINM